MFILFKSVSLAIIEIFLLGLSGFYAVKKQILPENSPAIFSNFVMNITFPCLIFSSMATRFNTKEFPDWWIFPLTSLLLISAACFIGWLVTKIDSGISEKGEFINLLGFQNLSYLPLPIIAALFPKPEAEKYFIYIFLFFAGYAPLMVSLSIVFMSKNKKSPFNLKSILNPSFIAVCFSVILVGLGLNKFIPATVLNPVKLLGDCTIPLAMFVLGGVIYTSHKDNFVLRFRTIFELSALKLVVLPILALLVINALKLPKELAFILFIQATMPPATTLINISETYGGNSEFIGQSIFYSYLVSLVTIPFWIGLYMFLC